MAKALRMCVFYHRAPLSHLIAMQKRVADILLCLGWCIYMLNIKHDMSKKMNVLKVNQSALQKVTGIRYSNSV